MARVEVLSWLVFALALGVTIGILVLMRKRRHPKHESAALAAVRQRRALRDELRRLVADEDELEGLLRAEGRRLGFVDSRPEVLESVLNRLTKTRAPSESR